MPPRHPREPQCDRRRDVARRQRRNARRVLGEWCDPLGGDLAKELTHQKRHSAGGAPTCLAERPIRVIRQDAADERRDLRLGERGRTYHVGGRVDREPVERVAARTAGRDQRDRQLLEPPGEESQELDRRGVRPVDVVDEDRESATVGRRHVRRQPVETVPSLEPRIADRERGTRGVEHRSCEGGGAGQPCLALGRRGARQCRLEQLAHDAEGELLLELASARAQDAQAGASGEPAGLRHQRGLPDARRSLDHEDLPQAAGARTDPLGDRAEIGVAAQQLWRECHRRHVWTPRSPELSGKTSGWDPMCCAGPRASISV
jgi:hypothetical protein